ncbi:response regulator transcription factor [Nocardioides ultimimeridianus]
MTREPIAPPPWSVLIVDDSAVVRDLLRFQIEDDPRFELAGSAGDGPQALSVAARIRPQTAICDIMMPGMSGLELIPRLRRLHPDLVVVTFSGTAISAFSASAVGIDRLFDKGHDLAELLDELDELCAERLGRPPTA